MLISTTSHYGPSAVTTARPAPQAAILDRYFEVGWVSDDGPRRVGAPVDALTGWRYATRDGGMVFPIDTDAEVRASKALTDALRSSGALSLPARPYAHTREATAGVLLLTVGRDGFPAHVAIARESQPSIYDSVVAAAQAYRETLHDGFEAGGM